MTRSKKITLYAFCILSFLFIKTTQAQSTISNSGIDQTTFEIIKTRTSILENFKKHNLTRVKTQRDSLKKEYDTDNHLPFFPAEYWLLCFWTKDYTNILNDKYISDTNQYNNTYISYPIFDNMGDEIRKSSIKEVEQLKTEIAASTLDKNDKNFLKIILLYSIHRSNESKDTLQLTLNELARTYLNNNPKSPTAGMLNNYVIKDYNGLKGADEILFGAGYSIPYGKFSNYLSGGFHLEIIDYRRYFGSTFLGVTANILYAGKTTDSVIVNKVNINKDESFNTYYVGLDVGNRFFDNKYISLSAFGGGAYNALSITHVTDLNNKVSEQVSINTYAARIGLAFDFKFIKQGIFADFKHYSDFNHCKFLRLKYDYQIPMYKDKAPELTGGFHNLTLSIGFNTREVQKK